MEQSTSKKPRQFESSYMRVPKERLLSSSPSTFLLPSDPPHPEHITIMMCADLLHLSQFPIIRYEAPDNTPGVHEKLPVHMLTPRSRAAFAHPPWLLVPIGTTNVNISCVVPSLSPHRLRYQQFPMIHACAHDGFELGIAVSMFLPPKEFPDVTALQERQDVEVDYDNSITRRVCMVSSLHTLTLRDVGIFDMNDIAEKACFQLSHFAVLDMFRVLNRSRSAALQNVLLKIDLTLLRTLTLHIFHDCPNTTYPHRHNNTIWQPPRGGRPTMYIRSAFYLVANMIEERQLPLLEALDIGLTLTTQTHPSQMATQLVPSMHGLCPTVVERYENMREFLYFVKKCRSDEYTSLTKDIPSPTLTIRVLDTTGLGRFELYFDGFHNLLHRPAKVVVHSRLLSVLFEAGQEHYHVTHSTLSLGLNNNNQVTEDELSIASDTKQWFNEALTSVLVGERWEMKNNKDTGRYIVPAGIDKAVPRTLLLVRRLVLTMPLHPPPNALRSFFAQMAILLEKFPFLQELTLPLGAVLHGPSVEGAADQKVVRDALRSRKELRLLRLVADGNDGAEETEMQYAIRAAVSIGLTRFLDQFASWCPALRRVEIQPWEIPVFRRTYRPPVQKCTDWAFIITESLAQLDDLSMRNVKVNMDAVEEELDLWLWKVQTMSMRKDTSNVLEECFRGYQ